MNRFVCALWVLVLGLVCANVATAAPRRTVRREVTVERRAPAPLRFVVPRERVFVEEFRVERFRAPVVRESFRLELNNGGCHSGALFFVR